MATVATADGGRAVLDAGGRVLAVVSADEARGLDPLLVPIDGVVAPAPGEALGPDGAGRSTS